MRGKNEAGHLRLRGRMNILSPPSLKGSRDIVDLLTKSLESLT